MDMEGVLVRRMGLRKNEGEAAWRPIALLWARSNLMEDKGRLHTHPPPPGIPWHAPPGIPSANHLFCLLSLGDPTLAISTSVRFWSDPNMLRDTVNNMNFHQTTGRSFRFSVVSGYASRAHLENPS